MKIFFDNRWPAGSGIGVVARELTSRLASRHDLVDLEVQGRIGSPLSPLRLHQALQRIDATKDDVFWNPGFVPPTSCIARTVVTVHDLTHLHFYSVRHRIYYNLVLKRLYKRCASIVCVSEYSKDEFCKWSGYPRDKVHVIYNAVSQTYLKNSVAADLGFQYVLYPGNYRDYKNLNRLMQAYAQSNLPSDGVKLVITGPGSAELHALAAILKITNNFVVTGFLEEQRLAEIYRGAQAIAFVSLYEGFGLPILEGMASDVPVLTSDVSAMPEIAGTAAMLVDPYSIASIRAGLDRVVQDVGLRQELIQRGRSRVKDFSWAISAGKLERLLLHIGGHRFYEAPTANC